MPIQIRNPHSVLAVLETRPKDIMDIHVPPKATTDAWERVIKAAKDKGIRVSFSAKTSEAPRGRGAKHDEGGRVGTAEATVKERQGISVEELFAGAREKAGGKGVWLALDSLTDPHNVGAIFRTASFLGVQGILMTQERSAPLTGAVYDVSSGGVEHVPFTLQTNLQRAFEVAKEAGLWILGTSEHANDNLAAIESDRPWLVVLGNEEKGMRRLTEESCDVLCKIPSKGEVTSLNVSVAAGIVISKLTGAV